eukprot:365520-Chlamydomonas_euryale.AAC.9
MPPYYMPTHATILNAYTCLHMPRCTCLYRLARLSSLMLASAMCFPKEDRHCTSGMRQHQVPSNTTEIVSCVCPRKRRRRHARKSHSKHAPAHAAAAPARRSAHVLPHVRRHARKNLSKHAPADAAAAPARCRAAPARARASRIQTRRAATQMTRAPTSTETYRS